MPTSCSCTPPADLGHWRNDVDAHYYCGGRRRTCVCAAVYNRRTTRDRVRHWCHDDCSRRIRGLFCYRRCSQLWSRCGGSPTTMVPGQVGSSTTTPATPPTYTYTTTSDPEMIVANNLVCNPQGQLVAYSQFVPTPPYPTWNNWTTDDPLPPGYSVPYTLDQIDNATKAVTSLGLQCSAQVTTTTTLPPPSPSEAWAASIKVLPLPQIRFSPSSSGLVHLETWFWLSNDAAGVPVTVSATAGGDTIAATVEPVSYTWTFGPSAATETSYTAGSAGQWRDCIGRLYIFRRWDL